MGLAAPAPDNSLSALVLYVFNNSCKAALPSSPMSFEFCLRLALLEAVSASATPERTLAWGAELGLAFPVPLTFDVRPTLLLCRAAAGNGSFRGIAGGAPVAFFGLIRPALPALPPVLLPVPPGRGRARAAGDGSRVPGTRRPETGSVSRRRFEGDGSRVPVLALPADEARRPEGDGSRARVMRAVGSA